MNRFSDDPERHRWRRLFRRVPAVSVKQQRQQTIARLIGQQQVANQPQLLDLLAAAGITATQATVSRDLDELGAIKVRVPGGQAVYALPELETDRLVAVRAAAPRARASGWARSPCRPTSSSCARHPGVPTSSPRRSTAAASTGCSAPSPATTPCCASPPRTTTGEALADRLRGAGRALGDDDG